MRLSQQIQVQIHFLNLFTGHFDSMCLLIDLEVYGIIVRDLVVALLAVIAGVVDEHFKLFLQLESLLVFFLALLVQLSKLILPRLVDGLLPFRLSCQLVVFQLQ